MRDSWSESQIADVAEVLSGFAFKSEFFSEFEGIPLIRIRDLQSRTKTEALYTGEFDKQYEVNSGDFLIGMDGEFRCHEWIGPKALLNQRVCRIQSFDVTQVVPRFIYFMINHYLEEIENSTSFTTVKHISTKQVREIRFPKPPLVEQRRIVDLTSSVDSYIAALQQQADAARSARSAVMSELLSAGGDDWTETTLGEVCEIYQPETISKAKMDESAPYVVFGANGPVGRYSRFNHEEPEVVVTCRGATCGVVNMTSSNCWITGNAMVVKPKDKRSTKRFLFWALQTTVDVQATISGSAQPQITRTSLAPSKIKVPPLVEQKRIVEIASSMDDVIQSADKAVADAKNLRSGLLSDLLSGAHEIPESYDRLLGAA